MLCPVGGWSLRYGERNSKQFSKNKIQWERMGKIKGCVCSV